jgi:STE24 endopeptidase
MNLFSMIFLVALGLATATQLWLSLRQVRHVLAHRPRVPAAFAGKVTLEEHHKGADYSVAKQRFGRIETAIGLAVLLGWTFGGALNWVDQLWRGSGHGQLLSGTGVIVSVMLISAIIDIPASWYRTFVLEERFGFNTSTPRLFVSDLLKGGALVLLIGIPLVLLVLWLMAAAGRWWWLYAWLAMTLLSLLLSWAFPRFIAPLFNNFEPLRQAEVRDRIEALLKRCGFKSRGVFVMDGSRRSSHGNAYFTGLGSNKRIVFFDTLLKQLTPPQVEAVLAHELGHFGHRHILKGMLLSSLMMLAGFAALAWLMRQQWFYAGLGVEQPSLHMALILFVMASPAFTFFITPLLSWYSRRHEFEADAFAAAQTSAEALSSALVGLYRENASTLTPDPLHSAFHDSHPPAAIRIAHLARA